MARNANVTCTSGAWTELTNSEDASGDITVAVIKGPVRVMATATGTEPSSTDAPLLYDPGDGWSEATIAEKFPGVATAVRLWARPDRPDSEDAVVFVSYA